MPKYTLEIAKANGNEMKPIIYEFEAPDVNAAKERKKVIEDFLTQTDPDANMYGEIGRLIVLEVIE